MKFPRYLAWYEGRMYAVTHLSWSAAIEDELVRVEMVATAEPFETVALFGKYIDALVLRQFTGHYDKHGKAVYAGDIVIAPDYLWAKPHEIVWPYDEYDFIEYALSDNNIEVIGNIYEHPHLLVTQPS